MGCDATGPLIARQCALLMVTFVGGHDVIDRFATTLLRWGLSLALSVNLTCFSPDFTGKVFCGDNRACPTELSCLTVAQENLCVPKVCTGQQPGAPCLPDASGITDGRCVDDDGAGMQTALVCRQRNICGNYVIESDIGEVCDDGNQRDGDGCSAICNSIETCGNGVVDISKGEQCEGLKGLSGDGCDSTCKVESAVWTRYCRRRHQI
jgi:cysteine-rich repeat protein